MKESVIKRKTNETDIYLKLVIDSDAPCSSIESGCGFLDHMLQLFAKHGNFSLEVKCKGDTNVDCHHSVEDIGICLGMAFKEALGDKTGITRYGSAIIPMDEALVLCALDISGRSWLSFDVNVTCPRIGDFDTELIREFFTAFSRTSDITLHLKQISGINLHHIFEACFKAFARALCTACSVDSRNPNSLPSTKGLL